jgi:hypothetical protein
MLTQEVSGSPIAIVQCPIAGDAGRFNARHPHVRGDSDRHDQCG